MAVELDTEEVAVGEGFAQKEAGGEVVNNMSSRAGCLGSNTGCSAGQLCETLEQVYLHFYISEPQIFSSVN